MVRRSLLFLCVACFSEEGGTSGTANGTSTSADSETSSTSTTTLLTDGSSESGETMVSSTGPSPSSGDESSASCTWPLEWPSADRKDIVIVVQLPPTNLSALTMRAAMIATADGTHIAIATACDEVCKCCGEEGDGFEHHTLTVIDDPLAQAEALKLSPSFFREGVPRHLVVLPDNDTAWTVEMLAADARFASAQIDVRGTSEGSCGTTPTLDGLADATHGSIICGDLEAAEILDDAVLLGPQPGCGLFGDPAMGPPPGPIDLTLTLEGTVDGVTTSDQPEGPVVCDNSPEAWTIVDAMLGHLALCPVACRNVGDWTQPGLSATVEFPC